jgi:hypothetical protein
MLDDILQLLHQNISHRIWFISDLQQSILERLLPLSDTVKAHFYGRAHIGYRVWVGQNCYRNIPYVDDQKISQTDVAFFENIRGNAVRPVFVEIYEKGGHGILFSNHTQRKWEEVFFVNV